MNINTSLLSLLSHGLKRQISITLAVIIVVLALPVVTVLSMGEEVTAFLKAAPSAEAAETQGFYMGGPVEGDTYAWGNCTYWAFAMRLWAGSPIPTNWGNANTWDDRARVAGYVVDHIPRIGAVYQTDEGDYGHVAVVTIVDAISGRWTISEMNAPNLNVVSTRTFAPEAAGSYNFIYTKKGSDIWTPSSLMNLSGRMGA